MRSSDWCGACIAAFLIMMMLLLSDRPGWGSAMAILAFIFLFATLITDKPGDWK